MTILDLSTDVSDGVAHVRLSGELDISSADKVEQELERVDPEASKAVVLDLRELSFMDSTGLRLILETERRTREHGRRFALVRGPHAVQRVFDVTRLDERLDFVDDPGDVVAGAAGE